MPEQQQVERLTAEEAVAALTAVATEVTDEDSSNYGRTLVHCLSGGFGADWDLNGAIALARRADEIAWSPHWFGHDLAILADGKVCRFNAARPVEGGA